MWRTYFGLWERIRMIGHAGGQELDGDLEEGIANEWGWWRRQRRIWAGRAQRLRNGMGAWLNGSAYDEDAGDEEEGGISCGPNANMGQYNDFSRCGDIHDSDLALQQFRHADVNVSIDEVQSQSVPKLELTQHQAEHTQDEHESEVEVVDEWDRDAADHEDHTQQEPLPNPKCSKQNHNLTNPTSTTLKPMARPTCTVKKTSRKGQKQRRAKKMKVRNGMPRGRMAGLLHVIRQLDKLGVPPFGRVSLESFLRDVIDSAPSSNEIHLPQPEDKDPESQPLFQWNNPRDSLIYPFGIGQESGSDSESETSGSRRESEGNRSPLDTFNPRDVGEEHFSRNLRLALRVRDFETLQHLMNSLRDTLTL